MGKKYIASIMDKHNVGDESFIYSCNHVVVGEIDEETYVLTDEFGNKYNSILSSKVVDENAPYAYSNLLDLDEMDDEMFDSDSYEERLEEYEAQCKGIIHYVGKTDSGKVFFVSFDKDNLKALATESEDELEDEESDYLLDEMEDLVISIINGDFSLSELKELRAQLFDNVDLLRNVLDTVELQIEATEQGKGISSFIPDALADDDYEDNYEVVWSDDDLEEEEQEFERINISDLFNKVTRTLIAQDDAARRVITEIARKEIDERKKREGILLTGSTGVGKSELMRLIAKYLNKPFFKIDTTQLTVPGYTGLDIEEALWDLYIQCGRDKELAEHAIIFFDEVDKKGSPSKDDHSGQGVLNILLQFIEGTTYKACKSMKISKESVSIDTSNMTVILGGAFTDVYNNLAQKVIGFNASKSNIYDNATTKDFVEKGMMTEELMGRVMVIRLKDLEVEDLKRILLESDESAMNIQKEIFDKLGVKLTFTDDYTTAVASSAYKKKTGARGLNGYIDESTWQVFEEVYSNPGVYEEAILGEDSISDSNNYQLVKKRNETRN